MANGEKDIHVDIYNRLNGLTEKVAALSGEVQAQTNTVRLLVASIEKKDEMLMRILKWGGGFMFFLVLALLTMAMYGAFGKGGVDALKDAAKQMTPIASHIPGSSDICKFFKLQHVIC